MQQRLLVLKDFESNDYLNIIFRFNVGLFVFSQLISHHSLTLFSTACYACS